MNHSNRIITTVGWAYVRTPVHKLLELYLHLW
jgi:hypothetical protein